MSDVIQAHGHSIYHREEILASTICGCFYCKATFPPSAIGSWTDDDTTALCPRCGIDSVIGDASGYPIDGSFLSTMRSHWF